MSIDPDILMQVMRPGRELVIGECPEGLDALWLADMARLAARQGRVLLHVARLDARMDELRRQLRFFAPELEVLQFPAWDCLPYDRTSPNAAVIAERMGTLAALARRRAAGDASPLLVLTTVNALLQRTVPPDEVAGAALHLKPGAMHAPEELAAWLVGQGFSRTGTVAEPGEFAQRGSIIDLFAAGMERPVRLDFFGDELESIREFDVASQRTVRKLKDVRLDPASEVRLTEQAIARFRTGYAEAFGGGALRDPLAEAVRAGRRYPGMEFWLPLFHEALAPLTAHVGGSAADACWLTLDHEADAAARARLEEIADHYQARQQALEQKAFGADPYRPLPPERLWLTEEELKKLLARLPVARFSPFAETSTPQRAAISAGGRKGRNFAAERANREGGLYDAVVEHVARLRSGAEHAGQGARRVLLAAATAGARDRLAQILGDHGLAPVEAAKSWGQVLALPPQAVAAVALPLEAGFESADLAVVTETDILGERLGRRARKRRRAADFISELSAISPGDLVVHVEHGIGRFEGLRTIDVGGAPHDCLHLTYAGGDRLFLPVENIDLLTRYGGEEASAQLDRLGSGAWQAKKAKLKQRLKDMAEELIRVAAARQLLDAPVIVPPEGLYEEFCARFPYEETEDQLAAIDDVFADLARGQPMDRLICGDVGFGKTEVALRAAFATVMSGHQVAVVVPTTLLARQHTQTFRERFAGYPVNIAHISRLTPRKEINAIRQGLADGTVDIVIGTHALLGRDVRFRDLGLLVIDEEQHFGVKHKERLKTLKTGVHVLTLTATPIPRTLQLALTGVRGMSIIATPPVDRLAVRTFISPFDPVAVREYLLREHYRGGQSYYVVPRVADVEQVAEFLREQVPEVKFAIAHGQMAADALDEVMTAFQEKQFDVLLATTIIESGLDMPNANTMIVHRADMFGLAQLYQLRGRIGRSKVRGWCLLTIDPRQPLTEAAKKRLEVLQSLDSLGAGFQLASHDLDIRGAGNLLGEEQSGHIREVGFELYQQMLEEAVAAQKGLAAGGGAEAEEETFSPNINIGAAVLIPEFYVPELDLRMGLYRRLAALEDEAALDAFAAEMADRFGPLPEEVRRLLEVVGLKMLARRAHVASVDAGAKGAVLRFHRDSFPQPEKLMQWIGGLRGAVKLRPDMRLVAKGNWDDMARRVRGVERLLQALARLR